jgi:hypothetical protein
VPFVRAGAWALLAAAMLGAVQAFIVLRHAYHRIPPRRV